MKKYLLAILAIAGLLFAISCTNDTADSATLTLSKKTIELSKDKGEESVTVTTDQDKWDAIGSAEWIEVTRNGNKLVIDVAENMAVTPRKAKVLVFAGNVNASIDVIQAASEGVIIISPSEIDLDQYGGESIIDVRTNSENWEASTEADWITLREKTYKSELLITVNENASREERRGKVFITVGDVRNEIKVTQSGILYYLTPLLEVGSGIGTIIDFESDRKSINIKSPDGLFNQTFWDFATKSPLFTKVRYSVVNDIYKEAVVFVGDKELFKTELEGFQLYLVEQGWTKVSDMVFYNDKHSMQAIIGIPEKATESAYVYYGYAPKQDKPYPTFEKFPYGFLEWGVQKAEIDAYEEKNGGTYNPDKSLVAQGLLFYDNTDEESAGRAYIMERGLIQTAQYFLNMNLVFYEAKGDLYFTDEFTALCEKEGFAYQGFKEWHRFENTDKSLILALRWAKYQELDKPVIDIRFLSSVKGASVDIVPNLLKYEIEEEEIQIPSMRDIVRLKK